MCMGSRNPKLLITAACGIQCLKLGGLAKESLLYTNAQHRPSQCQ